MVRGRDRATQNRSTVTAPLKAAHISSDHDLQVLQGVVHEQKMPTLCRQDLHDG